MRFRHYQPKTSPDVSNFTDHVLQMPNNLTTQQSFSDTALTAFTQLIALRLASQRAIVSLIDHENEYFLADSTSTLSLIDKDGSAQNAWLSISRAQVPRDKSLCEQTLRLVPIQNTTAESKEIYPVRLQTALKLTLNTSYMIHGKKGVLANSGKLLYQRFNHPLCCLRFRRLYKTGAQ